MRRTNRQLASLLNPPITPLEPVSDDPATARRERTIQLLMERAKGGGIGYLHRKNIDGDRLTITLTSSGTPADAALQFARVTGHARRMGYIIETEAGDALTSTLTLRSICRGDRAAEQASDLAQACRSIGLDVSYTIEPAKDETYDDMNAIISSIRNNDDTDDEPEKENEN